MKKTVTSFIMSLAFLITPLFLTNVNDNSQCVKYSGYDHNWETGMNWPEEGQKKLLVCQVIPDSSLREELGRSSTELIDDTLVNQTDLNSMLGEDLNISNASINNLDGLQYLVNLKKLSINNTNISDINSLKNLTNLEELSITNGNVKNIRPLGVLSKLTKLDLSNNNINNLDSLVNLENLKELNLSSNAIDSIAPLSYLTNLENLYLSSNNIKTIYYLKDLTKLNTLSLENNLISDVEAITDNQNFEHLYLSNNMISDFSNLNIAGEDSLEAYNQNISFTVRSSNNQIEFHNPLEGLNGELIDLKYENNSVCNSDGECKINKLKRDNSLEMAYENRLSDAKKAGNITGLVQIDYGDRLVNIKDLMVKQEMSVPLNGEVKVDATFITDPVLEVPYNSELDYYSDNLSVATVDNSGNIFGHKLGEANIYVVSKIKVYNSKTKTSEFIKKKITVTVDAVNRVSDIKVKNSQITLLKGDTYQINPIISPENATFKQVRFTKDKDGDGVISLSDTGEVYALDTGKSKITISSIDNKKIKSVIEIKVEPIKLDVPKEMNMMDIAKVKTIGNVEQFRVDKDILEITKVKNNEYNFYAKSSGKVKVTYYVGANTKTYTINIGPIEAVKKVNIDTNDKNKHMVGFFEIQNDTWFNKQVVTTYTNDKGKEVLKETRTFVYSDSKCEKTNKYILMNCGLRDTVTLEKDGKLLKRVKYFLKGTKEVKVEESNYSNGKISNKIVYDVKGQNGLYEYNYNSKTTYKYKDGKVVSTKKE